MDNLKTTKFIKFCLVGSTGAIITFGTTWLLTEVGGLWYMMSLCFAVSIAMTWNFTWNAVWTFSITRDPNEASYDWFSFYNGSPIQKWWKQSIAKTVWKWIPNENKVLDIGCGSSPIITKYPNAVGIDENPDKLDFMTGRCNCKFISYSLNGLGPSVDLGLFDSVLCIELIEHVENPESFIRTMSSYLRPGGTMVIASPDYSRLIWRIAERFTPTKGYHINPMTGKEIEKLCGFNGLRHIKHKYVAGCDYVGLFRKDS